MAPNGSFNVIESIPLVLHLSQKEAAQVLGLHVCTLKKYWRIYRKKYCPGQKRWPSKMSRAMMKEKNKQNEIDLKVKLGKIIGDLDEIQTQNPPWNDLTPKQPIITCNIHEMPGGLWNRSDYLQRTTYQSFILIDPYNNVLACNPTYLTMFQICNSIFPNQYINHYESFMQHIFPLEFFTNINHRLGVNQTFTMTDYISANKDRNTYNKFVLKVHRLDSGLLLVSMQPTTSKKRLVMIQDKEIVNEEAPISDWKIEHFMAATTIDHHLQGTPQLPQQQMQPTLSSISAIFTNPNSLSVYPRLPQLVNQQLNASPSELLALQKILDEQQGRMQKRR